MATVSDGYPLYYDATNEKGLSIAGLNFPDNAVYFPKSESKENVAPFELIPYILGSCSSVGEALKKIENINLWNIPFSKEYPLSPLHWMLADKKQCVTIEPMKAGLKIYKNSVGVLTNNPPFDYHMYNLANYMNLTPNQPENRFGADLKPYSLGMGAIGLPGDLSSASRFVRAAFTKNNSVSGASEEESVNSFFHILTSVEQVKGLNRVNGEYEYTVYSSCCNADRGIYYYITYNNRQITAVDMMKEDINGNNLIEFPLNLCQQIIKQN
jgi:choloylglycine hydrolase